MRFLLLLFLIALCGTRLASSFNAQRESRIVGGQQAGTQVQYAISLQKRSEEDHYSRGHRCGGALITLQHAVTAAFCNFEVVNGVSVAINPAEYRVFAGYRNLTVLNYVYLTRGITNITVHPDYHSSTPFVNDIAVIFLAQAFTSNILVPALLPTREPLYPEASPCSVAGWGAQDNSTNASVILMNFNKYPSNQGYCRALYNGQINVIETMMCAVGVQQTEFAGCTGDIGNPLVCSGQLFGVLIRSKNCTVSADPEVYTRVYRYNPWINSLIGTAPAPAPGGASTFQPGLAVLAVITFAQILITNVSS